MASERRAITTVALWSEDRPDRDRPTSPAAPEADACGRRDFLRVAANTLAGGIAVSVAAVAGRAAIGQSLVPREARWVKAARLDELETNVPTPITLRIPRQDGYLETVDQQTVFLVRSETSAVHALSSSCAHLGCSVAFNAEKQQFVCPCHNGVFNVDGSVVSGPAPRGLDSLVVRVEKSRVLVQV